MNRIEQALTEWYGERCDEFESGCECCEAWKEFDELKAKCAGCNLHSCKIKDAIKEFNASQTSDY